MFRDCISNGNSVSESTLTCYITFLFRPVGPVIIIDVIVILLVTLRFIVGVVTGDYSVKTPEDNGMTHSDSAVLPKLTEDYAL